MTLRRPRWRKPGNCSPRCESARAEIDVLYACGLPQAGRYLCSRKSTTRLSLYTQARDVLGQLAEKNPSVTEYQVGRAEVSSISPRGGEQGHSDKSLPPRPRRLLTGGWFGRRHPVSRNSSSRLLGRELHPIPSVGRVCTFGNADEHPRRIVVKSPAAAGSRTIRDDPGGHQTPKSSSGGMARITARGRKSDANGKPPYLT